MQFSDFLFEGHGLGRVVEVVLECDWLVVSDTDLSLVEKVNLLKPFNIYSQLLREKKVKYKKTFICLYFKAVSQLEKNLLTKPLSTI